MSDVAEPVVARLALYRQRALIADFSKGPQKLLDAHFADAPGHFQTPRPRLFRHRELRSLQNAMGFNNAGMESLKRRLTRCWPPPVPVGVNIGKNRQTELAAAAEDYRVLVRYLGDRADYFVINISSPNTPGLRDLQQGESVARLLEVCQEEIGGLLSQPLTGEP